MVTHEISHVVEGANNGTWGSPAFPIWGDSKWAEFFIHDVYTALGQHQWAADVATGVRPELGRLPPRRHALVP